MEQMIQEDDFWYRMMLENGGQIHLLKLWNGVMLSGGSIRQKAMQNPGTSDALKPKINFCLKGRCEVLMPDEHYVYMEPETVYYGYSLTPEVFYYPRNFYDYVEVFTDNQKHDVLASLGLDMPDLLQPSASHLYKMQNALLNHVSDLRMHILEKDLALEDYRFLLIQIIYEMKYGGMMPLEHADFTTYGQRHIITEAEKILTSDLSKRYTVSKLAEQFGVSPSTFKMYFEKIYGTGVSEYMRLKRIEQACQLLTETRENISDIALSCGYANPGKFSEVFRKQTGITPMEYRRRNIRKEIYDEIE